MTRDRGRQLSARQAAELAGMTRQNWHGYRVRRVPKGNPIPEPDGDFDGRPWWWEATVLAWMERRPGSPVKATHSG